MLNSRPASPWEIEFHHMIHDLAGAFLFGVTFLFTMELWWRGNTARPPQMLFAMAVTYIGLCIVFVALGSWKSRKSK